MNECATVDAAAPSKPHGLPWRCLREPLLHFLLAGFALFAVFRMLHPVAADAAASNRIEITDNEIRQMATAWQAQGRAAPTRQEIESLVELRIREEIYVREAQALGLERNDTIVRRRLAQKMEFLAEDLSAIEEPARDELRAWFEKNVERFASLPRASFHHLYFSPDRRGARARDDAARSLARLREEGPGAGAAEKLGDRFMYQDYYGERSSDELSRIFGTAFVRSLLAQTPGAWQGPIESGYGWHLVRVDSITRQRAPAFEEVEPEARRQWITQRREERKRQVFGAIRARYEVIVPTLAVAPTGKSETAR